MEIRLVNVAKKFNKEWIFRKLNFHLDQDDCTAIIGPNGSGKSTLMQIIAGSILQSEGKVEYSHEGKSIDPENIYKFISLVAPAMSQSPSENKSVQGTSSSCFHQRLKCKSTK